LREAGDIIGVCVLDQIIVGEGRYVSFDDDGYW
jgi:DNA repair protein RadC